MEITSQASLTCIVKQFKESIDSLAQLLQSSQNLKAIQCFFSIILLSLILTQETKMKLQWFLQIALDVSVNNFLSVLSMIPFWSMIFVNGASLLIPTLLKLNNLQLLSMEMHIASGVLQVINFLCGTMGSILKKCVDGRLSKAGISYRLVGEQEDVQVWLEVTKVRVTYCSTVCIKIKVALIIYFLTEMCSIKALSVFLLIFSIFTMALSGLGLIILGSVFYSIEEFRAFTISESFFALCLTLGILILGFSIFGILGPLKKKRWCVCMFGFMSFIGFVIFIIFALAFRDISDQITKYVDRGEAASTSTACQAAFINATYTLDVLGEYDTFVPLNLTTGSNFGSLNCKIKGSSSKLNLTRTDKQAAANTYTLQSASDGKTSWFDCGEGIQTEGAKMKELMYKLIGKMQAENSCSGICYFYDKKLFSNSDSSPVNGRRCLSYIKTYGEDSVRAGIAYCAVLSIVSFVGVLVSFMLCGKMAHMDPNEREKLKDSSEDKGKDYLDNH